MSSEGAALRDRVRRSRSSPLLTMLSTHCLFVVAFAGLSGVALAQGSGSMVRVSCEGASAGAAVTINGKFKGDCPLDAEVPAALSGTGVVERALPRTVWVGARLSF